MIKNQGTVVVTAVGTAFLFLLFRSSGPFSNSQESPRVLPRHRHFPIREDVPYHYDQSDGLLSEEAPIPKAFKSQLVSLRKAENTTWDNGTQARNEINDKVDVSSEMKDKEILLQESQKEKELWEKEVESREAVFAERRKNVAEVCKNSSKRLIPTRDIYTYRKLVYVNDYKFMWCPVLKAGSTVWINNLRSLLNLTKVHRKKVRMSTKDSSDKKRLMKTYFTFMIVRHPLDRLLSAYRDKMLHIKSQNFLEIQKEIVTAYRPKKSTFNSTHPTFTEFLQRVRDDMRANRQRQARGKSITINQHWEPYWSSCSPCQIDYSAILKTETMSVDQEKVIRILGLQGKITKSKKHTSHFDNYGSTQEATVGYYSEVPLSLLEDVVKEYQADFDLFDYSPKEYFVLAKANL